MGPYDEPSPSGGEFDRGRRDARAGRWQPLPDDDGELARSLIRRALVQRAKHLHDEASGHRWRGREYKAQRAELRAEARQTAALVAVIDAADASALAALIPPGWGPDKPARSDV